MTASGGFCLSASRRLSPKVRTKNYPSLSAMQSWRTSPACPASPERIHSRLPCRRCENFSTSCRWSLGSSWDSRLPPSLEHSVRFDGERVEMAAPLQEGEQREA